MPTGYGPLCPRSTPEQCHRARCAFCSTAQCPSCGQWWRAPKGYDPLKAHDPELCAEMREDQGGPQVPVVMNGPGFLLVEVLDGDGQVLEAHTFGPLRESTVSRGRKIRVYGPPGFEVEP